MKVKLERVAVSGSRHWEDRDVIERRIYKLPSGTRIAHGAARGADRMVDEVAKRFGFEVAPYPIDHALDGPHPRAGRCRTQRMLKDFEPQLLIAFRAQGDSPGTDGAIRDARKLGIRVEMYHEQPPLFLGKRTGYTSDPRLALFGEPEAVDPRAVDELNERKAAKREKDDLAVWTVERQKIEAALKTLLHSDAWDAIESEVRVLRRRLEAIDRKIRRAA